MTTNIELFTSKRKLAPAINMELLSPEQRRIVIASDVIAGIKAKRFKPTRGYFVDIVENKFHELAKQESSLWHNRLEEVLKGTSLRDFFNETECKVCALGAMFVSMTEVFDEKSKTGDAFNHELNSNIGYTEIEKAMGRYFEPKQLKLIETAFERGCGWHKIMVYAHPTDLDFYLQGFAAVDFGINLPDDHGERMMGIMQNVVDNGGTFVPPPIDMLQRKEEIVQWVRAHSDDPVEDEEEEEEEDDSTCGSGHKPYQHHLHQRRVGQCACDSDDDEEEEDEWEEESKDDDEEDEEDEP